MLRALKHANKADAAEPRIWPSASTTYMGLFAAHTSTPQPNR